MVCRKCKKTVPDGLYCVLCGSRQDVQKNTKKRGNGQGTIKKLDNGKYMATVTLGYYADDGGKLHRQTKSKVYATKKDAVAGIPSLFNAPKADKAVTFKQLYDKWLPTHRASKATLDCYRAAFRYFAPIQNMRLTDSDVDDLQECVDDCPKGTRTRQNMTAVCGLVYKYGIPRHAIPENLNLAPFLIVEGENAQHRVSFTDEQIEAIKKAPDSDAVYCMIYTGFRPSEFLALTAASYDKDHNCLVGGAKTDAGKGRTVTVSPKIKPIIEQRAASDGYLFSDNGKKWELKAFTENVFYPVLDAAKIENPMIGDRHKYTPHSCRHTFATLLKRVPGADKDKQELIGHASAEMLRYYQDTPLDDLQKITDQL